MSDCSCDPPAFAVRTFASIFFTLKTRSFWRTAVQHDRPLLVLFFFSFILLLFFVSLFSHLFCLSLSSPSSCCYE